MKIPNYTYRKLRFVLFVTLLFAAKDLSAQLNTIEGRVLDQSGLPLAYATVQVDSTLGTVTDEKGIFKFQISNKTERIDFSIRHLGYTKIDTIVPNKSKFVYLEFYLTNKKNELDDIEITASKLNAFRVNNWKIFDFDFVGEDLIILFLKDQKRQLGLFSKKGLLIHSIDLDKKYEKIHISCGKNIHLVGVELCLEVQVFARELTPFSNYSKEVFSSLVEPCIFKNGDHHIFKNITHHKKKATYFNYQKDGSQKLLYKVHDKASQSVSRSHYMDIIKYYYKKMGPDNIISRGEWSGELIDLWIDNDIHPLIAFYLDVESKPISTFEYTHQNRLYIIDYLKQQIIAICPGKSTISVTPFNEREVSKYDQIIFDAKKGQTFILNKDLELIPIVIDNYNPNILDQSSKLKFDGFFPRNIRIDNGELFYLTNLNATSYINTLRKKRI